MYKMLLFLKKTKDNQITEHFKNYTIEHLSVLAGRPVKTGIVESNLLLDEKYMLFCELSVNSKEEWDKLMDSDASRELNKDLMEYHQFLTVIFINYSDKE